MTAKLSAFVANPNIFSQWWNKKKVENLAKKAKQKGLMVLIKCYRDTGVELITTKKPVKFVEFKEKNEKDEEVRYICRVVKTKHRLKGTSIPVHFVGEGINENLNLFEGAEVELSAEYVNKMNSLYYYSGLLTGLAMRDEGARGSLEKFMPILVLIIIFGMLALGYLTYQTYDIVVKLPHP